MPKILILYFLFISSSVAAQEKQCETWQIFVKAHKVKDYIKNDGTKVKSTFRKSHCREKWKNADKWGVLLKNYKPKYWPNKNEVFKVWTKSEIKLILKTLSELPIIDTFPINKLLRASLSKDPSNPASSISEKGDIVFYDEFFKAKNKKQIICHEAAHIIYSSLKLKERKEFARISGWKTYRINNKDVFVAPNKKIKPDSNTGQEEDFANYFEVYITDPKKVKKINSQVYSYLLKRFPL